MYAAGFDLLSRLGWALAAAVVGVFALRALVVERSGARALAGPPAPATGAVRFARRVLDAASVVVVLALLVVLALVVVAGIGT